MSAQNFSPDPRWRRRKETIYQNKLNIMQLPRGTFREIKKNETVESILLELERTKFSGICSISSGSNMGTLVFKGGKCILVKFQGKQGDAGWDELQKILGEEVDAALSSLDDAQVQLSLEFNKMCRIIKAGKIGQQQQAPAPLPRREHHETVQQEPVKKPPAVSHFAAPAAPVKTAPKPAPSAPATTVSAPRPTAPQKVPPVPEHKLPVTLVGSATKPASQIPPSQGKQVPKAEPAQGIPDGGQPAPGQGASSFDSDIDTFDTMDLENVTDKIRNDCKTMIKQLHLEHLMER
jgi:ribosomal protein S10